MMRSSSIIGGAQVVNIIASLAKMKVAAVLLGPTGVGLVGLYMNLIQTAATVASLGIGNVGTRQIALANEAGGAEGVGRTRRVLFWGTTALAVIGAALFWLSSGWIARVVLADESRAADVAWLSLGVALTIAAGSQGALLTGLRRVGDLARLNVAAGVVGAALGVMALFLWGAGGLLAMVLVAPVATFLFGHVYVARLGRPTGRPAPIREIAQELKVMVRLGAAFMISGLITMLGQLAARMLVQHQLGSEALGQFQAAWAIGMTYLGFVLGAMGTDYYPRLAAVIHDPKAAVRLVNEQTEVALLLCAPVLLAMLGLAPWVVRLLYSEEFGSAVDLLRWQLLGDLLKVMSWPLGFTILAAGAGKTFVLTETFPMAIFLLGLLIGLPLIGLTATGIAFIALYAAHLPLVWLLARRRIGFRWTPAVKMHALAAIVAAMAVHSTGRFSEALGAVLGLGLSGASALWAVIRLSEMSEASGYLRRVAGLGQRMKRWMIKPR